MNLATSSLKLRSYLSRAKPGSVKFKAPLWQCRNRRVGKVVAVHVILNSERDTARNLSQFVVVICAHISRRSSLESIRSPSETLMSSFHSPSLNHHCLPKVGQIAITNYMYSLLTNLDVQQARCRAVHLSNHLISYSAKVIPALWTKLYPTPEPVLRTVWGSFMVKVQEPVAIPTYQFYLVIFILFLDILSGLWNAWESYGTAIMETISQFKLVEGFLGRCDSISSAIRNAPSGVWRPMVNTAINRSHKGCDAIAKILKIKAYDTKASDVAMDAGKGNSIRFQASTNNQVKKIGYPLIRI